MPGLAAKTSAEHGKRALTLAGRALDPNAVRGPALGLGQELLRDAYVACARAICEDPALDSLEEGSAGISRTPPPVGAAARRACPPDVVAILGAAPVPPYAALLRAQMAVALLVDEATGDRRLLRAQQRALWIIFVLVAAVGATMAFATTALTRPWEKYAWVASSAFEGFPLEGTLGERDWEHDLVVHTDAQPDPWVRVDLLATRTIRKVVIVNRADCCADRGLPLTLEVALDDRRFVPIATRRDPFVTWEASFPSRKARYVRLRAEGVTIINLREIQIR